MSNITGHFRDSLVSAAKYNEEVHKTLSLLIQGANDELLHVDFGCKFKRGKCIAARIKPADFRVNSGLLASGCCCTHCLEARGYFSYQRNAHSSRGY